MFFGYSPEAIDELEKLIKQAEADLDAGASFRYTTTFTTGARGSAAKKAWIPRGVANIVANSWEHVCLLILSIRERDQKIKVLQAELDELKRQSSVAASDAG